MGIGSWKKPQLDEANRATRGKHTEWAKSLWAVTCLGTVCCSFHHPLCRFQSKQIMTHTFIHLVYLSVAGILDLVGVPLSIKWPLKRRGHNFGLGLGDVWKGWGSSERGMGLSPSGVTAWPSQGDDEDRDVIPGTQLVVGETPATVPGDAPGPQDQSLGQSCIPARSTCAHSCTDTYTRRQRQAHMWVSRLCSPFVPSFTSAAPQHLARQPPTCWGHWAHRPTAPCPQWRLPHSH